MHEPIVYGAGPRPTFLRALVRRFRAEGPSGAWDGKTDGELIAPLVRAADRRRGRRDREEEADPDVFWRIEVFYAAVGEAVEERTAVPCTPMLRMHHAGFGRVVVLAGRLVVVDRFLRDVTSFGFESIERLSEAGERLVDAAVELIERFPEAARLGA